MEMTEQQIAALMAQIDTRVDARVDSQISAKVGNMENITPIAFENKYMKGYTNTWPIDQALFRKFLHSISTDEIVGKFFKTIGGAVATTKEDTLTISGLNGITISANGKTITINGSTLKELIDALYEFENEEVKKAKVKDLFEKYADTHVYNKYLTDFIQTMTDQDRVDYWNDIITTCRTEIAYTGSCAVPYDEKSICYIYPKTTTSIESGVSHIAIVELREKGTYFVVKEHYTSNNPPVVDMAKLDGDFILNNASIATMVAKLTEDVRVNRQNIAGHEQRISALEGN